MTQKTTPRGTTTVTDDEQQKLAGGGQAEGSHSATSHTPQPVAGPRPGGANTPGGAMNTGPDATENGGMGGSNG